jgi:copper(I)-binding protein
LHRTGGGFVAVSRSYQSGRVAAAVALAATALLATACSAGQTAQTATHKSTVDGGTANVGDIALRNVRLAYPPGGRYKVGDDAPLLLDVVNTGAVADSLISVRTDAAPQVELRPAATGPQTLTPPVTTSTPATPTGSGGGSATATVTASAPEQIPVRTPAGSLVAFGEGGGTARLLGLTRAMWSGQIIMITFNFARAGSVTVEVPVATPLSEVPQPSPVLTTPAAP